MAGLREQKKQETREAICTAAMRLFTEKSYEETSIEDIACEAGIGKTTIYGYFSNKEEIFITYCNDELEQAFAQFREDCEQDKPLLERLVRFFIHKFAFVTENTEFGRQMMREMLFPSQHSEKALLHDRRYLDILDVIFAEAQERGEVSREKDRFYLSVHCFSIYLGALTGWFKGYLNTLEEAEASLRLLFQQALEGIQS